MMNVQVIELDPKRFSIDARSVIADGRTIIQFDTNELVANVHHVNDEQLAAIWSTGSVEDITLIVNRNDGQKPFASIKLIIPGFRVSYFWSDEVAEVDDDRETLVEQITLALCRELGGDVNDVREDVKRLSVRAGSSIKDTTPE